MRLFQEDEGTGGTGGTGGAGGENKDASQVGAAGAEAAREAAAKAAAEAAKGGDAAAKAAADKAAADKKAAEDAANKVPEKYEFKTENGQELDQTVLGEFTALAKENKMTQAQATKFFELGQKLTERHAQEFAKHVTDTRAKWVDEIKSDPVLGSNLTENLATAKKAIALVDKDGALTKWLNESGAGDNPHLVRAFFKIGQMISNDKLVTSQERKPPAGANSGGQPRLFSYANSDHNR